MNSSSFVRRCLILAVAAVAGCFSPSAASADDGERWVPVADECVVAMHAEPFGDITASDEGDMRRSAAWLTSDMRCGASGLSIREKSGTQTNYRLTEGDSDSGTHFEWAISDSPSAIEPRPLVCGSTGTIGGALAFLTSNRAGPPETVWSAEFALRPNTDCSDSTVFRTYGPDTTAPTRASGGCYFAVTPIYELASPAAGSIATAFRVGVDDACDGLVSVTGATEVPSAATPGSRLFALIQSCEAAPTTVTVSVPEANAVATVGIITERFSVGVDPNCEPTATDRERLEWTLGGLTECFGDSLESFFVATTVEDIICAGDYSGDDANVLRLYQAFFGRYPDASGSFYWLRQRRFEQISIDDLAFSFAESQEFADTYGSLDSEGFLTLLYANMLGRLPDSTGYDYWLAQIEAGLEPHLVVRWIVANEEFAVRYPFTT